MAKNTLTVIEAELSQLGFRPKDLLRGYTFADTQSTEGSSTNVKLAAFCQSPPSYRNAAFGIVEDENRQLNAARSLGAPLLLSIGVDDVKVWRVSAAKGPEVIDSCSVENLPQLFSKHTKDWTPERILRAKSIGAFDPSYQLDFVDLGLLPALSSEIQQKLDRLINEALSVIVELQARLPKSAQLDDRALFGLIFRLLAAKILSDRGHKDTTNWKKSSVSSVLAGIEQHYGLASGDTKYHIAYQAVSSDAWNIISSGLNVANVSSDDLAFVYENTLVSPSVRKELGTHSTPRSVAEYVVGRLRLDEIKLDNIRVFEPFCGAGVFLTAAMRNLRDRLPRDWNDLQRHKFLIQRMSGAEIDPFAREVAQLSLILADYPNENGWKITDADLFKKGNLGEFTKDKSVILCNPPFEAFDDADRKRYQDIKEDRYKAGFVLRTILDHKPDNIGFVMPRGFTHDRGYAALRKQIDKTYEEIELVTLPDRVFNESKVESSLLIARKIPGKRPSETIKISCAEVDDNERSEFLRAGQIEQRRSRICVRSNLDGKLWFPHLWELWESLVNNRSLGEMTTIHRGLEWKYDQSNAWSHKKMDGYIRGIHGQDSVLGQYAEGKSVYLDARIESQRGNAFRYDWTAPKIIVNKARVSRGMWRLKAFPDEIGFACSQQFFGIWPNKKCSLSIHSLAAVLNSPIANAFVYEHMTGRDITMHMLKSLPLPEKLDDETISKNVKRYRQLVKKPGERHKNELEVLLKWIDAEILAAYDLPPKLERQLLDSFNESKRPVLHQFCNYFPSEMNTWMSLRDYLNGTYDSFKGNWVQDIFPVMSQEQGHSIEPYLP